MPSLKEVVFGMVARKELSAAQALSLVQQLGAAWQPTSFRSTAMETSRSRPQVAVIGLAGRFPGASNPRDFWTLLCEGHSSIREAPPERWDVKRLYHPDPRQPGKTDCKWGGFLDGIADLDAWFFNIPPREAEVMDPQQRLFLESAWLALEDAGYGDQALDNRRCGVFVGVGAGDFIHRLSAAGLDPDGSAFMGNSNAILVARIAYLLNLKGPCLAIDTACSSSLAAIHLACESLAQGESELALAGGVCVLNTPNFYLAASKTGMLSPRGQCRAFDQDADGFVPGEAVGALVLKPLEAALRDGDHIYGVIEGSATNQDGRTNGITAPSAPSQTALEQEVYRRFAIDPASIGYVEAHGTGTRLGDPIEVEALTRAFRAFTTERQFCALGSVKTNVGHTMSAAGVVSVIKVLLALQQRQLPPSLHFTRENEAIGFAETPFFVNTAARPWLPRPGQDRRRAAVSSFGFSGTNVHLVIGEAPDAPHRSPVTNRDWQLFTLSARTGSALLQRVVDLEQWLREQSPATVDMGDLAFTLNAGRCHFEERLALVAAERDELLNQLTQWRREGTAGEINPGQDAEQNRWLALAREYVQGATPDWKSLYPPGSRRRLSLPGYPFERRRFLPGEQTRPRRSTGLHPLLDQVAPGEGAVRFQSELAADMPFLRDHQVNGAAILPGVCYLEMACAAAHAWRPQTPVRGLAGITFTRPLRVADEPVTVLLNLEEQEGQLKFTICSGAEEELPHCRGELRLGAAVDGPVPRLDLAGVRQRATRQLDRTALYRLFEQAGVACGPYCQGVAELWLGENEALAELRLPAGEAAALPYYTLHPTLLDGAFQTAMAWLAAQPGAADRVLVPFTVGEVKILQAPGTETCAYVQCRDVADARFDIALLDAEGRLQARLLDFRATALHAPERASPSDHFDAARSPALARKESIDPMPCYRPVWREEPLPTSGSAQPEGIALIVHPLEDPSLGERLARELTPRITLRVAIGQTGQSLAPGVFEIDQQQVDAWQQLCATLKPVAAVYFCATAEQAGDPLDLTSVEAAVRRGSLSLLRLVQALRQTSRGQPGLTLAVITQNAQLVMADDAVNPLSADVLGLTQTLSREVRDWRVSLVDVVRWDEASILEGLLAELGTEPGLAVAWRAGVRYCRFLEPVTVPEPVQSPFREQGVYVLAGGGGGLGLTVAQHLAATYRARVLLLGRSPLDVDRQRQVAEIAGTGGEVIHRTCDITDPTAIQMALTGARQRWGAVHGVMQAAMVLCDRALDHLDEESFQAVLAPKVQGSVALAQAVIGQPLDFFAFFSSANAFVGNVGQGNYAAASTFQDAFAHFLRQRGAWPVYLLNWGFWGEVGAVADPFHIRQAARLGIGAIGRAEGIDILERILASPSGQWMPMKASPTILTKLGLRCYEPLPQADGDAGFMALAGRLRQAATANPETASIAAAFTQVEAYGRALLARVWQEQGVLAVGQRFTTETLAQQLGLEPAHTRLLEALLALLAEDGWLLREENGWRGSPRLPEARGATIGALPPWTAPFIGVLEHCLRAYPQLLRGERAATEVLFGAEILPLVQALYRDNPIVAQYNRLCAEVIAARAAEVLQRQDRCRILEIGAGTGGTSAAALAALAPLGECIEYRYTDLSAGLVQQARRQFAADYPFARFLVLDIESNPAEQGIEPGSCDMVLAANVLHATARIHQTLRHVRQTLRPGGVLILNEAIHRQDFSTLTFGLTEGWWRFVDGKYRLPYSPLLSEASWRRILLTCGFQGLASATTDSDAQTVILAQADDRSPVGAAVVATTPHHAVVPSAISPPPEDSGDLPVWVEQKVRRALAQTLNLAPGEIDHRRRFADYGVDSILGVDLMTRLSDELGVILRATLLFDYACVADLSAHLIAAHEPELAARRAATFAGESSPVVDAGALFGRSVTSSPDPSPSRLEEKGHSGTGLVERIAIVGMAGRFPGAANLDAFWADLQAGRCRVTEVPAERWDVSAYYDPDPHQPDKSPCKWGGFLEGIADFDPLFFQMSGAEAEFTDPQQRLFMEEAWSALEHAGYSDRWLNQRRAGVFVGVGAGDYTHKMVAAGLDASPYAFMGNGAAMLAGRIAYLLNLRGPALAVDTACSSSLVALHLACQSLRAGECELALAGGVFVATTPGFHALTGRLGMLSSTGQCRVFDQNANGFVPGEGVGVVVLRPLEAAVQDGDTIHGVIVASGSNQDGRSNGIAAPSALAQRELLETVYAQSGVNPATISYVEAHGTGTKLGDPIEFEALNGAFRHFTDQRSFCTLGSVKANIGHAGPAAGVAGLLKVLLMLKHRQWPPLLHFTAPNPHITLADSPFYINRELQDWPAALDHPRRAAISSFGLSGTNAHVVVEEPPLPIAPSVATGQQHLLAISAHVPASLQTRLAQLQDWLAGEGSAVSMADIAYTLNVGRTHFTGPRAAVLVTDHADAIAKLRTLHEQGNAADSWLAMSAGSTLDAANRAAWRRAQRELLARPQDEVVLGRIAAAYVQGHDVDWNNLYPGPHRRTPMPTYPFSRARYWLPEPERLIATVNMPQPEQAKQALDALNVQVFRPVWQPTPVARQPLPSPILALGGDEATLTALRQHIQAEGGVLRQSANSPPFTALLQQLRAEGCWPAAIVVLPNPVGNAEWARESELAHFRPMLDRHLQPLLALAGALVRECADEPMRVISVHDDDAEFGEAFGAAAGGFDRSLRALPVKVRWTAVRLSGRDADLVEVLFSELRAAAVAEEVWWRQGQRYVQQRAPVPTPPTPTGSPWRRNGVYWITGGCGALGLLLTQHLVEIQGARVIVSGRTAPTGAAQTALMALGDHVEFLPTDVTDPGQVHHAYQHIRQRHGRLHGVIHAAGTLTPEPVHRKTAADFQAVLAPKIVGALLLDAVTQDEPLDCFVLFSSLAAAVGDFGQCDYAVANRFLDGFAAWRNRQVGQSRRQGRTLAMDWPLWEEGGLQHAKFDGNGPVAAVHQAALPTAVGLQALERWLASEESCITLAVDEATVALLQVGNRKQEIRNRGQEKANASLLQAVTEQVAAVVKLPPAQLDPQAGLASFGLDSLNMKRLAEQLSAHYQLPLNPTVLFEHNSIAALTDYLASRVPQESEPPRRDSSPLPDQEGKAGNTVLPAVASLKGEEQKQHQTRLTGTHKRDAIAIIGIAGRFPQSPDLESFWQHLAAGDDLITEILPERWNWRDWQSAHRAESERSVSRWGGFMSDIDRFDAALFGISPREAVFMDPQHRLFLETVWATVENAGYRPGALAGRDIGVFVGCQLQEYLGLIGDAGEAKAQAVLGNTPTMLANRVSFLFDWRGPSQTIDTACSSALVAVHRAMRALRDGECAWAIAGGAHLLLSPETYVLGSQLGMLSPDGRCKTFDQSANGYVKGEGVGAVLLKPLDQAEADGDHIQAVILASAENHGGRAHFLTAPNPEAQARLLVAAYTQADVSPETVSYIEAHGTGTELGDPIEVEALNRAFGELATRRGQPLPTAYCGLGSVKSNMGHLEPAAGIAGLLKVVLALRHQQLPATLHIRQVNPYLNLEGSPFYLVTQTRDWLPLHDANGQSLPRRAGVSSFGFGGSNAHLVLEECAEDVVMPTASLPPAIFPLSARSEPALRALAERLVVELRAQTDGLSRRWRDVLFTLQTGREAWPERLALVADSLAEGLNGLERWLKGELDAARIFQGRASTVAAELTLFDSSDELHAFARAELAKGRWDKIARLWAAGAALDWTQLGSNGRRLPLPGVPFADTRYWFNHRRGESVALTPNLSPTRQGEPEIPSTNAAELSAEFPSLSKEGWRTAPGWFDPAPLRARLRTLLADALYLPEDAIDDETPFVEMGLDSILAVELVNRLNKELGSDFKATRLYDHGTINALANYLAEHLLTVTSSPPDALPTDAGSGARAVDVANVQEEVTPEPIVAPSLPASASPEQEEQDRATAAVLGQLRLLLARLLYLDPADLDDDLELLELGLDTVSAGQLSRLIADTLGVELPAPRLLGYSGLATLAADIVAQREGTGSREQGQSEMELPCEIPPDPPFAKEGGECLASSIAIIGMAGRFPGAPDLDTFWQNLAQGVDAIREVPPERWDLTTCYDPDGRRPNSTYCRHGGFLENIDRFDPLFFNIAPQEAEVMDPQQRLFLEEAWKALEDAGYSDQALTNSRCAIYVGAGQGDYFMHSLGHDGLPVAQFGMGSVNSILAARLAYWLNLKGAAVALDTACSSSLVAVHLACRALQDGDCDLALAGGVSLMTTPQMHILTSQSQMLSPEGRCKTFANDADGFVPGEGVGVVVLKPLERALADRDPIHGVIIGSGLNQDGRTNGITAPSVQAQSALQQAVYQRYGINPETIGYVEAHGTGTKLGDPIEIEALTESFREYTTRRQFCAIGSVKTNIGHALPAAGIAGLLKVLLALRHRQLPPSLHCYQENEHIDFAHSPFRVNRELRDWLPTAPDAPRRAAINSFGFSGTNAHLVIEETPSALSPVAWNPSALPFTLSAKSKAALRQRVADLSAWLAQAGETVCLADLSYTLNVGRSHFRQRLAWVAATPAELRDRLAAWSADDAPPVDPGETAVATALAEFYRTPERQRRLLETLTAAYQAGRAVDWQRLYPDGACRRLNLPTYPFQGKRYWVEAAEQKEKGFWDEVMPGLLDSQAKVCLRAVDPLLNDHRVQGQAWLPAAGYLSLTVSAAAALIPQRSLTSLRDVTFATPFTVADDASCELQVRFTVADGLVRVTIASLDGVVERQHIQGQLNFTPAPTSPALDIAALQAVCLEVVAREAIHQRFAALGMEYGPTYRLLQRVWVGGDQVLGELATPGVDSRFAALPPGLLDSALQTLIGFALAELADGDRLMLPFAIDAVQFVGPLTNVCYVHARRRSVTGDTLGFDLSLSDDAGCVSLRLENFQVREIKSPQPFILTSLAMRWEATPWPESVPPLAGDVLILRAEQDFGLSAALRSAFPRNTVHEVWLANCWQRDRHGWWIDARSVADFSRLLQDIPDCGRIYFLSGVQDETELDLATLEISEERGLLPLFRLGQALAAQPLTVAHPHLVVVTHDSEAVGDETPRLPYGAACRGLAKVMGRENPGLAVTCLDLSRADLLEVRTDAGQRLAAESGALPFATVAWRGDQRYQPQLLRQSLPAPAEPPFRIGGTYLIIGGAGGLGFTVAQYLARNYQARLVLVGRRPVDPEIQARLDELRAMGGEALYLQGDVADLSAMRAVCREVHDRWGRLHGVIHAAAVLRDGLLARLSEADFIAVLRPKLAGTVALALALSEGEPPDWLALFSSTASLTANPGQGNYTAASVGQDAIGLALPVLLNIPVRVTNWGYWGEMGVAANATVQRLATTQGIGAIQADEGLPTLERILAGETHQIAVLKAMPSVLARMGVEEGVASRTTPALRATPPYPREGMHTPELLEQLVRAALREVLKVDEEDLDEHTPFEQYGVDSLIAIGVLQCLERQTGPLPKTLLFEYRTIAELVTWLEQRATPQPGVVPQTAEASEPLPAASILAIRATGSQPASFWVHSVVGEIAWVARLAEALGEEWPVYGFPARALRDQASPFATLEAMAAAYVAAVRQTQPHGPYLLGGYSFGGAVAFEMARQLLDQGEKIQGLLLLDAYAPGGEAMHALHDLSSDGFMVQAVANLLILQWQGSELLKPEHLSGDRAAQVATAARHLRAVCPAIPQQSGELETLLRRQLELMQRHAELLEAYQPQPCLDPRLPVLLVRSTRGFIGADNDLALQPVQQAANEEEDYGWSRWLARPPYLVKVAADHFSLGLEPAIGEVARHIITWLTQPSAAHDPAFSGEENAQMEQVFQVVKRHVLEILPHLPPEAITLDASLRELGANSLDRAEVAVCSMETLGVNVPRKELAAVTNLRELTAVLYAHCRSSLTQSSLIQEERGVA